MRTYDSPILNRRLHKRHVRTAACTRFAFNLRTFQGVGYSRFRRKQIALSYPQYVRHVVSTEREFNYIHLLLRPLFKPRVSLPVRTQTFPDRCVDFIVATSLIYMSSVLIDSIGFNIQSVASILRQINQTRIVMSHTHTFRVSNTHHLESYCYQDPIEYSRRIRTVFSRAGGEHVNR